MSKENKLNKMITSRFVTNIDEIEQLRERIKNMCAWKRLSTKSNTRVEQRKKTMKSEINDKKKVRRML